MIRYSDPVSNTVIPSGFGAYHGSFYSLVDQYYSANIQKAMEFEVTDLSNGVSITNNGLNRPTRITFDNLGVYNIQLSAQLHNNGGESMKDAIDRIEADVIELKINQAVIKTKLEA